MKTLTTQIRGLLTIFFLIIGGASLSAQTITYSNRIVDGSFETQIDNGGSPYIAVPPWLLGCSSYNSPDYQPGAFGATLPAYHGDHYAGMVQKGSTRGESISQALYAVPGASRFVVMYLASSSNYYYEPDGRVTFLHANPTIYPGGNFCRGEDTLWISPTISERKWRMVVANYKIPDSASNRMFLQIKTLNAPGKEYGGNIFIDSVAGPFPGQWPFPELGDDQYLCEGDSVSFSLPEPGTNLIPETVKYLWSDGNRDLRRTFSETGTYSVCSIWNMLKQCDSVFVNFEPQPEITVDETGLFCMGEVILVRASVGRPGYNYIWSDGRLDSLITVSQSSALRVSASNGICTAVDSTTVSFRDCSATLSMPNVFSPNGDGINDIFQPMKAINIDKFQLDIYDRWGRPVITLQHPDLGWDGTNSLGHPHPEGVYFWAVRYQGTKDEEVVTVKGNVTLVR